MRRTIRFFAVAAVTILLGASVLAAADTPHQNLPAPTFTDVKAPSTYMWTDKVTYTAGQQVIVRLNQSANGNPTPYASYFVYFENLLTGAKQYFPAKTETVTDMFGNPAAAASGRYPIYLVPDLNDFVVFGPGGLLGPAQTVPTAPGSYRYVMELWDATGTYLLSRGFAPFTVVTGVEILSGNITADQTLDNGKAYLLSGIVIVQPPATLTIKAGTILYGETATLGGLAIAQGAKINAVGTPERPIVFTSASAVGERKAGDWFGVALAGRAPINVTGGTANVEGIETMSYGGNDPDDNSGVMKYCRIEYSGIKFTPTREANGLYLCGVGRGTVLDHLHFNNNADDNIEFFGGNPYVKYIYCTGGEDDQLDWTEGFSGCIQFVVVQVYANSGANRGIEADNWEGDNDATPRSSPQIYNMTIVGPQQNWSEGEGQADHGLMLRRGTAGNLRNFIVIGYGRDGINMRDSATIAQASAGNLVFDNAILFNNGVFGADGVGNYGNSDTQTWIQSKSKKVLETNPLLVDPYHRLTPDYMPGYMSPALRIDMVANPPDNGFFEPVNFIGGIGPNNNWLAGGWTYISEK